MDARIDNAPIVARRDKMMVSTMDSTSDMAHLRMETIFMFVKFTGI